MAEFALPCIICGKELRNVDDDCENQPSEGTAFITHGHYGSTIFDPMDGRYLEINICDECVGKAADDFKVLMGQNKKLVAIPGPDEMPMPHVIGTTHVNRSLVHWSPLLEKYPDDQLVVIDDFEEYERWEDKIDSVFSKDEIKEMFDASER